MGYATALGIVVVGAYFLGSVVRRYILPQALTAGPSSADLLSQYRVAGTEAEDAPGGSGGDRSSRSGSGGDSISSASSSSASTSSASSSTSSGSGGLAPETLAPDVPPGRAEAQPAAAAADSPARAAGAAAAAESDPAVPLPGAEVFVLAQEVPGPAPAGWLPLMRFTLEVEGAPTPCVALFQVRSMRGRRPSHFLWLLRLPLLYCGHACDGRLHTSLRLG